MKSLKDSLHSIHNLRHLEMALQRRGQPTLAKEVSKEVYQLHLSTERKIHANLQRLGMLKPYEIYALRVTHPLKDISPDDHSCVFKKGSQIFYLHDPMSSTPLRMALAGEALGVLWQYGGDGTQQPRDFKVVAVTLSKTFSRINPAQRCAYTPREVMREVFHI